MKRIIAAIVCLLLLFMLTGCQSAQGVHDKAKKLIEKKVAPDVVTYHAPAGDTLFSDVHEFYMYSEELDDSFLVYVDNWRDDPTYYDTYLSVKYADQAEHQWLVELSDGNIEELFNGSVYVSESNFSNIRNPIKQKADLTFEDWYNSTTGYRYMTLFVETDDSESCPYESIVSKVCQKLLEAGRQDSMTILWIPPNLFSEIDNDGLRYAIFGHELFYQRAQINEDGVSWLDPEPFKWVDVYPSEVPGEFEQRWEAYQEFLAGDEESPAEFSDGSDLEPVEMPDPEALEDALEQGQEYLENYTFDHLQDKFEN